MIDFFDLIKINLSNILSKIMDYNDLLWNQIRQKKWKYFSCSHVWRRYWNDNTTIKNKKKCKHPASCMPFTEMKYACKYMNVFDYVTYSCIYAIIITAIHVIIFL